MANSCADISSLWSCMPGGTLSPFRLSGAPRIPYTGGAGVLLRASVVAGAIALSGCSSMLITPSADVSMVPVPAVWSNGVATASATPLADWWQRFDDPQLTALVTQALQANNDIRRAMAALQQSRALRDATAAGLLPTANAAASAQRGKSGGNAPFNAYQVGFDAGWEPDIFGGVRAGVAAANANTGATAASLGNVQVSIAAEVAATFMELRALELRLGIARDNLASQEQTQQIAEWRAQAGLTTSLDVEQARTSTEADARPDSGARSEHRSIAKQSCRTGGRHARGPAGVPATFHGGAGCER